MDSEPNFYTEMHEKANRVEDDGLNLAADAANEVNHLKMLYRTHRIPRESYQGGLAALVAAGLIDRSQFTVLNNYTA
jgi:hypothetical protein